MKQSNEATATDELLDAYVEQFVEKVGESGSTYGMKMADFPAGRAIQALDRQGQADAVEGLLDRLIAWSAEMVEMDAANEGLGVRGNYPGYSKFYQRRCVLRDSLDGMLRRKLPLSEARLIRLLRWPLGDEDKHISSYSHCLSGIVKAAENFAESGDPSIPVRSALEALFAAMPREGYDKDCRKLADRLRALLPGVPQVEIQPGEAWSDAALADLGAMDAGRRQAWEALLLRCRRGAGQVSARWSKEVEPLREAVGFDSLKAYLLRWFPLIDKPRTRPIEGRAYRDQLLDDTHVELLRGLVWCCGLREDADLARALTRLAISAYRKIPGQGPRLVSLGNATIAALGTMPGLAPVGQLALLKVKVKFGTAQNEIGKALVAAAKREGLPPDEIEELAVPSYGLEEVGHLSTPFGEYRAELAVDGSSAGLHWFKGDKPVKSAPATVRKQHPEEYKELQGTLKDVNAMLPAQRERIDGLFLARKSWPLAAWRERYLDHPLVGTIARRLIWTFTSEGETSDGIWEGDALVGLDDKPLGLGGETVVSPWHPIGRPTDDVLAWRDRLERREVVQPFKQAHREVYLLTDAERRTRTYSNRFAAHVLKQHQFNALCAARGWKHPLRLMVDNSYPPASRLLPEWGLRAEYWVEGAGDQYGRDTNETGTYLYLTTDQVRFYALDAPQLHAHAGGGGYGRWGAATDDPLPLETIPPLVLSEIMRDVDLFVGVASVGNDPSWADGGPGGRYRAYWQGYSFGELSATAQTRRALLERLLPRLRIVDRCSLSDRFLHVRGDLRGYKIHLGSGNILMTPNDQYLCIVPRQAVAGHDRVFLPFEGDGVMSVILSKAFLLAEDAKIVDPTITSQLKG